MSNYWLDLDSKGLKTVDFGNLFESVNEIMENVPWKHSMCRHTHAWVEEKDAILEGNQYGFFKFWGKVSVYQYEDLEYRIAFFRTEESNVVRQDGWLYHFDLKGNRMAKSVHPQYN